MLSAAEEHCRENCCKSALCKMTWLSDAKNEKEQKTRQKVMKRKTLDFLGKFFSFMRKKFDKKILCAAFAAILRKKRYILNVWYVFERLEKTEKNK